MSPDNSIPMSIWSEKAIEWLGYQIWDRLITISDGSNTLNIDYDQVKSGFVQKIQRVCVENETSDYTRLRIGVLSGGIFHPLQEQHVPEADKLYWSSGDFYLAEGDNLRVELTGTTTSDRIAVYISGFEARVRP